MKSSRSAISTVVAVIMIIVIIVAVAAGGYLLLSSTSPTTATTTTTSGSSSSSTSFSSSSSISLISSNSTSSTSLVSSNSSVSSSTNSTGTSSCAGDTTPTYKIGVIEPLTGALGSLGKEIFYGADLAAKQWNSSTGGVKDACGVAHPIQLLLEDGGPDTTSTMFANLQSLHAQGVDYIIGPCCSADFSQAGPYVSQNKILTVSSSATAGFITSNFTSTPNYIWRTVASDNVQTLALAAYVEFRGFHHVELVVSNEPYGLGIANGLKTNLLGNASISVKIVPYDTGSSNYGTYPTIISGVASDHPDVIVYAGFVQDLVVFWKDVAQAGAPVSTIPSMGVEGLYSTAFFPYQKGNSGPCPCATNDSTIATYMQNTNMTGTATLSITNTTQYINFANQYNSTYHISCANGGCLFAPETYDAANLTFRAMALAGGFYNSTATAEKMVAASQGYIGASGPKTFNVNGDVTAPYLLWKVVYNSTTGAWAFKTVGDWFPAGFPKTGLQCISSCLLPSHINDGTGIVMVIPSYRRPY